MTHSPDYGGDAAPWCSPTCVAEPRTVSIWLDFPEGDVAISADLTRYEAAMRHAATAADRATRRGTTTSHTPP